MDGWWTFAHGTTTTLHLCLSTRRDETNEAVSGVDTKDRSHGSIT
jgi:hypothetical protein